MENCTPDRLNKPKMAGFRLIENNTLAGKVKLAQSPFITGGVANTPKRLNN